MAEMSPLRRRMIEDMRIRNLSPATQRCYVHVVAKFSQYFKRSPDRLALAQVRAYQVHLVSGGVSWDGFNQAVCALRFFYGVTLGRSAMVERIPYARKLRPLPVVLSADEVARFLAEVPNLKHRMALTTAYAAGLRVSEVVRLRIADIDSARMMLRVEQGKGGKDRYVMLSPRLLTMLRSYWRVTRPPHWLFPGQTETRHLDPSVLQAACRAARAAAGFLKPVAHAASQLRHPSPRSRHGHSHHPGAAGSSRPVDHDPLRPDRHHYDRQHAKPARPVEAGEPGGGVSRHAAGLGGGGGVPSPRRCLSQRACRSSRPD